MKKYDDLTARLLERRDRYVAAQAAKRKRLMRVALPAGGGLLVALLCVGLWQGGAFENTPPVTDGSGQGTTVPAAPTTATGDSAPTDADGIIEGADTTVTTVTTTDVTPSDTVTGDSTQGSGTATQRTEPTTGVPTKYSTTGKTDPTATKTERPTTGKPDPTKSGTTKPTTVKPPISTGTTVKPNNPDVTDPTTTTTKIDVSDWPVISADTPQFVGSDGGSLIGNEKGYLTRNLKKKMKIHDGEDVLYAVVVEVLLYLDEYNGFWQSTEELVQFDKEYWDVYYAYEEEAKRLNPDFPHEKDTVWSDEMRENYNRWLVLDDERRALEKQYQDAYYLSIINPRVDYLKEVTTTEMIPISEDEKYYAVYGYVGFYAELPAETLRQLEKRGDYVVRLVSPEGDLVRND